jgi:hypothetical protein
MKRPPPNEEMAKMGLLLRRTLRKFQKLRMLRILELLALHLMALFCADLDAFC